MPNGNLLGSGVSYELSTVYSEELDPALGLGFAFLELGFAGGQGRQGKWAAGSLERTVRKIEGRKPSQEGWVAIPRLCVQPFATGT